jgi:hypothetical protein
MGFNRLKMEDQRRQAAEKEVVARRATDAQVLEDAKRLIAAWNERQTKRMPMLFNWSGLSAFRPGPEKKPCSGHLGLPDLVQNALGSRLRE